MPRRQRLSSSGLLSHLWLASFSSNAVVEVLNPEVVPRSCRNPDKERRELVFSPGAAKGRIGAHSRGPRGHFLSFAHGWLMKTFSKDQVLQLFDPGIAAA